MHSNLMTSIRSLLAHPDRPDRDALFAALADAYAPIILGCLAPPGSLAQIAAAMERGWSWDGDGWERHTAALVAMITDPQCPSQSRMIETWSRIPNAVGVLRDQTDTLIAWAAQRLLSEWYANLAILLGPSDASARLLMRSPFPTDMSTTLRRWSMGSDPDDSTMWQAMIDIALRKPLRREAPPSWAFPAWGWDNEVDSDDVLHQIVTDLLDGWSPDHPSIRKRIGWIEHHVDSNLHVGSLAVIASIGGSATLAEAVCTRLGYDPSSIPRIASEVPWHRLHPRIQTVIDTTMLRSSDAQWKRTWACAIGHGAFVADNAIDESLLMWRIAPERWDDLDPPIRAALVSNIYPPTHCYGWGIHPDLVEWRFHPYGNVFRFWNPDVPSDDLRAWAYADLLRSQSTLQDAQVLTALLDILPSNRRTRFEQIIDWRVGGRSEPTAHPPWEWTTWASLPAVDRQTAIKTRLAVLWESRATLPAVRFWRAHNDGLATLALMVSEMLGLYDPSPLLTALLAHVPALRGDETAPNPPLPPLPTTTDTALRAQIERVPLAPDVQTYAAWCLWVLACAGAVGADLIALHPDVAVALAPVLTIEQRAMVTASPVTQGWDAMTVLRWAAACEKKEESISPPIQRRIR